MVIEGELKTLSGDDEAGAAMVQMHTSRPQTHSNTHTHAHTRARTLAYSAGGYMRGSLSLNHTCLRIAAHASAVCLLTIPRAHIPQVQQTDLVGLEVPLHKPVARALKQKAAPAKKRAATSKVGR